MVPASILKEYLLTATTTTGKSLHPIILIFDQQPTYPSKMHTAAPAFQIKTTKSDARRLSNYLNQSLDQFFN